MSGHTRIGTYRHVVKALVKSGVSSDMIFTVINNFAKYHHEPLHLQQIAVHEMKEAYIKIKEQ